MPRRARSPSETDEDIRITRQFPAATSIEARENQLISLAIDRAEQQIRDGTASSQVLVHYLKLGSTRERMEKQLMAQKLELDAAKTEMIQSSKHLESLFNDAIAAMRTYSGKDEEVVDEG